MKEKLLVLLLSLGLVGGVALASPGDTYAQDCTGGNLQNCGSVLLIPSICETAETCVTAFVNIIFIIAALLTFIYLIWGGIDYITAGGDEGQVGAARMKITNAVIGLVIVIASWAISQFVLNFFLGEQDIIPAREQEN